MKKIFLIFSIVILLGIAYLIILNLHNYQPIHYSYTDLRQTLLPDGRLTRTIGNTTYLYKTLNIAGLIGATLLSGIIVGAGTVYLFLSTANTKIKAYERELERTSVTGQNNASKVEVLEAKIKTLEKAFSTVIDERTKLEVQIKTLNAELDSINGKE